MVGREGGRREGKVSSWNSCKLLLLAGKRSFPLISIGIMIVVGTTSISGISTSILSWKCHAGITSGEKSPGGNFLWL